MSAVGKIKLVAAKLGPEEQYKLLPDGRAFYIGSTPTTAYYTPSGNNRNKTFGVQLAYIFSLTEEDRYNRFENFYEF